MLKIWNNLHQVHSKYGITFIRYAQNLELPSSGTLKIKRLGSQRGQSIGKNEMI
jgi:hypothetical protein